jgi:hypothetical protein
MPGGAGSAPRPRGAASERSVRDDAPFSRLPDPRLRRLLARILAAVERLAPGGARGETARTRPWGRVVVDGPGTRRLPGLRIDRRAHVLSAATDGRWIQLSYRVDGDLRDAETVFAGDRDALGRVRAFFEDRLERVWWKAPRSAVAPGERRPPRRRPERAAAREAPPRPSRRRST